MISAPKGTRDILPGEIAAWHFAEQTFAKICSRYGYQEIRVPTFEQTDLFQRGVGDTTDIVQKEMYTFLDKGGRSLSLRPEGTAGIVRAFLENGLASAAKPVRLYYNITAFRYENVQKGRYREFHQFGCEAFGAAGPAIDAELISLLHLFFRTLGLKKTSLKINSIGCPSCRGIFQEKLRDYFRPHLQDLCANCQERFVRNPLRIVDCKEDRCRRRTQDAPAQLDYLCPDCQAHFDGLRACLEDLGLDYAIDRQIVRGLDYYTRTVFEFVSENVGTQGTICGGGRYDGLIKTVGGPPTPGVGFALGVERLLMELDSQGQKPPEPPAMTLYILAQGSARPAAQSLCFQLRQAGIRAETDLMDRSFGAQMKYAGKGGTRYLLVLGDDELQSRRGRVRDLMTRAETEIDLADLADWLRKRQPKQQARRQPRQQIIQ